ncbi:MAG: restriction endonuclease subunit S [Bacteroidales bacterium]|nr:restriction endonuclease subunit S [Bacteroidales bacterium]
MIERNLCRLEDVCDFQNGFAFKSTSFTKEGEPILRISDIQGGEVDDSNVVYFNPSSYKEDLSRFVVYPNDIVIAMSGGTTGKVGVNTTGKSFYLNQRVGVFREKEMLNHSYLYYYLLTKSEESLRIAAGAAQPNLSTAQIKSFIIPIPHLDEQQRIVDTLDAEFAKIDALKENAEKNLQNAKDLFQAVLRKELEPKEGWKKSTIAETCILKSGNSNANNSPEGLLPFVKVGDMNIKGNEERITCSTNYVSYECNKKNIFPIGTIIFPKRGGAILTNKKRITSVEVCCDLNVMGVYSKGSILSEYLFYYFLSVDLSKIYNGAAIPQINNGDIGPLTIYYPINTIKQQEVVKRLSLHKSICNKMIDNYAKTVSHCNDLKQALLRKAFNGEL